MKAKIIFLIENNSYEEKELSFKEMMELSKDLSIEIFFDKYFPYLNKDFIDDVVFIKILKENITKYYQNPEEILEDLIIETEPIDRTQLSDEEKVVIDCIESNEVIKFDITREGIYFFDKYGYKRNYWNLKNDEFDYSYIKIFKILNDKFEYNSQQTDHLVKDILLKHYKIKKQ